LLLLLPFQAEIDFKIEFVMFLFSDYVAVLGCVENTVDVN